LLKGNNMTEQATTESATTSAAANTFGLQDLVFTMSVYEICAQRGAFKADEMTQIGAVFDRLKTFLTANGVLDSTTPTASETTGDSQ
jgi:hypothetical protein